MINQTYAKIRTLSLLLFACSFLAQPIFADMNKSCNPCSKPKKHKSCDARHVITEEDFLHHGKVSKTLVISKPGNYCFGETIHWKPKHTQQTAIVIDADQVYLDLNGFELKQVNTKERATGILVTTGHNTVSIANGAVRDFTQLGIVVEGGNSNIFLGNEDTFLKVTGCGYGSTFSFLDNVTQEPILQGGIQLGQTKVFEARGYYTWQGNIATATLTNVFAEENGPVGLYLGTGSNISTTNSSFCRNSDGRQAGNPDPIGLPFVNENWCIVYGTLYSGNKYFGDNDSNTFEFLNCHFDNNNNSGTDLPQWCSGLFIFYNVNGLTFRNCTFNSNTGKAGFSDDSFGTSGVVTAGCQAVLYEDCEANNNYNENWRAEGFHHSGVNPDFGNVISGQSIVYRRCNANNNICQAEVFPAMEGFGLFYMHGLTVEDCVALNNTGSATDPDNAFGYSDGLVLVGNSDPSLTGGEATNGVISGCHFAGNKTNFAGGDVEGIYIASPLARLVIRDCVVQENNVSDFNSGIWLAGQPPAEFNSIIIENCIIENQFLGIYSNGDTNGIYQYNTITDVDYGILLDGSSCDSVNNNYVTNASNGFVDFANLSTSLFANNKTFGVTTPFDVTYAAGPISTAAGFGLVTGDLTANPPFPSGAQVLDNVAMAGDPVCTRSTKRCSKEAIAALKECAEKARQAKQERLNNCSVR